MRRLLVAVALVAVAVAAAGCASIGTPAPPPPTQGSGGGQGGGGTGGTYNGEPTRVVVRVLGGAAWSPLQWLIAPARASEPWTAVIRIANYQDRMQIYERFESRTYDAASGAAVEMQVPAKMGYEVSTVVHGSGLKRLGLVTQIHASADTTTVVEVPVGPPTYQLSAPSVVYGGGSVLQFRAMSDHPMYSGNTDVLIGTRPWPANGTDAFWRANDAKAGGWGVIVLGGGGVSGPRTFPAVAADTTLYYQVRVCAKPMYANGQMYCYYEPDVEAGQPLWTSTLSAGAP